MSRKFLLGMGVGILAGTVGAGTTFGQVSFQGVGYVPGFGSVAHATSADGTYVVGNAGQEGHVSGDTEAFRWTQDGMMFLGDLPGGPIRSWGKGVSDDGTVVIGEGRYGDDPLEYQAIRWMSDTGTVGLGFLPGGTLSTAEGVSADGIYVAGTGNSDERSREAFRWTEADGMQRLGGLVPGKTSWGFNISADGSTVIGAVEDAYTAAGYWTEADGWVSIGKLQGGLDGIGAFATDSSVDGSVIVGNSSSDLVPYSFEPFIWTASEGMLGLGLLNPTDDMATTTGMSGDGSIVVGVSGQFSGARGPYMWDLTNGMRDLADVFVNDYGMDLLGWTLIEVVGMSRDGTTYVGFGINPEGITEGWVATIPGGSGGGLELAFEGSCPSGGSATVTWTGATPNGRVGLVFARSEGAFVVPGGPCAGTELGLGQLGLQVAFKVSSDADGNGSQSGTIPGAACGSFLQLVDVDTCAVSNVVLIE